MSQFNNNNKKEKETRTRCFLVVKTTQREVVCGSGVVLPLLLETTSNPPRSCTVRPSASEAPGPLLSSTAAPPELLTPNQGGRTSTRSDLSSDRGGDTDMQAVTCALLLAALSISSARSEADSCPAVCECSEWGDRTISCFDIDTLPRFPASTEAL